MQKKRPLVVTCVSLLLLLFGLSFPIFLFSRYPQESIEFVKSQCGLTAFLVRHFGGQALATENALLAIGSGILGLGLWRLLPWSRVAIITVSSVAIVLGVVELIQFKISHSCSSVGLIGFAISGALLYYFSRAKVKQVFVRVRPSAAPLA